jgi:hypothetical protein
MGGIRYIANVLNQKGAPAIFEDTLANRPSAGYIGRIFISTNTFVIQRDNGTTWDSLGGGGGITGSGVIGQVTFWTGASAVSGDNGLFWDNTTKRLGVGTTTPAATLDVNGGFRVPGIGSNVNPTSAGTIPTYLRYLSTGSDLYVGTEGITAGGFFTGSGAYDSVFYSSTAINLIIGGVSRMKILPTTGFVGMGYTAPTVGLAVSTSIYQGSNVANSNFQMLCNQNFYTVGFSPNFSTYTAATVNISVSSNLGTGYVFKTTAAISVNLPAASGLNNQLYFVVLTGTTVTVNRSGSDVFINNVGTSVTSLTLVGHTKTLLYSDGGTTWYQLF